MTKVPKLAVVWLIILALVGLGVAVYLTVEHMQDSVPTCHIVSGCERVLTSEYSAVGPVPTAAFGVLYYSVVVVLAALYWWYGRRLLMTLVNWLAWAGLLVSLYLVYLQVGVIGAICMYCMTSALVCILLFITDLVIWWKYLRKKEQEVV